MGRRTFRANSTEINMAPTDIRYVFVVGLKETEASRGTTVRAITTYRSLSEAKDQDVSSIKVVDLYRDTVSDLIIGYLGEFLDEWRENYFDSEWDIPFQFFK